MTKYRNITIDGRNAFYREAGPKDAPAIILLHSFPSSSHMFRDLIPQVADRPRSCARLPRVRLQRCSVVLRVTYTFDNITAPVESCSFNVLGLTKFSIYVQDYGAPVGVHPRSRSEAYDSNALTGYGSTSRFDHGYCLVVPEKLR